MQPIKALKNFLTWATLAILFNIAVLLFMGKQSALEFVGGYIIELSLSMDNLFLFLLIFSSFGIKSEYQKRVLNYGIIGAIILRLVFILLGISIVNKFHWILYFFGALLIISGTKMLLKEDKVVDFRQNFFFKAVNKIIPITHNLEGEKFFIKKNKMLYATPLFAILVIVESSDLIFAIDSIPAIFSITTNPFIVYTSNIFAILGLRNLYFLLEKLQSKFRYVKYGVALILVFTGMKLVILFFHMELSIIISLIIITSLLLLSILASVIIKNK